MTYKIKKTMKTIILLILFVFSQDVNWTIYNAAKGQTDSNPLETADGSIIDLKKLNEGKIKWIAISRDLKSKYPFGTKVVITGCKYEGVWEVRDVMNKRYSRTIDFLVPSNVKLGKGKCKISKK